MREAEEWWHEKGHELRTLPDTSEVHTGAFETFAGFERNLLPEALHITRLTPQQEALREQIDEALAKLPPAQAELIRERYFEQRLLQEMADDLGLKDYQAVQSRLKTAERNLAAALTR